MMGAPQMLCDDECDQPDVHDPQIEAYGVVSRNSDRNGTQGQPGTGEGSDHNRL
jgi:hypothetical protein